MQDFAQQAGDKATRCHDTSSLPPRWGHQPVFPRAPKCRAFKRPPETEDQILEGHMGVTRPHPGPPPSSGSQSKGCSQDAPGSTMRLLRTQSQTLGHRPCRLGRGPPLQTRHPVLCQGCRHSGARKPVGDTERGLTPHQVVCHISSPGSPRWPWFHPQSEEAPADPQTRGSQQPLRDSRVHLFFPH